MSKSTTAIEKLLFSSQSFLNFTLQHEQTAHTQTSSMLTNGTRVELWDTGVLHFQPRNNTRAKRILISAGVHGNETAPVEIIDKILSNIFSGEILVEQNLLIILANPPAIRANQRFTNENMNRLFGPEHVPSSIDNYERERARQLMHYSSRFFAMAGTQKLHYDLHTAIRGSYYKKFAILPKTGAESIQEQSLAFLKHCGIEAMLVTEKNSATYSKYTAQHCGANSATLELGKVKPFGQNDLADFSNLILCLQALISGQAITTEEDNEKDPVLPPLFYVHEEVIKQTDAFRLCFAKDIANFTEFEHGTLLATDLNYEYRVKESGERILFPNEDVAIGQRALMIIKPVNRK